MDILSKILVHPHKHLVKESGKRKIKKGKILRVKPGYNPNSSSMGSIVFSLPQIMLGVTTIFGVVSGIIISKKMKKHSVEKPDKQENTIQS